MEELPPIQLQPGPPTQQALRAATVRLSNYAGVGWDEYVTPTAEIIDKEMGLKDIIGKYNNLVLLYEDEHEMRIRVQHDLKSLKDKLAKLSQEMVEILRRI
jgi:hypothetical protein